VLNLIVLVKRMAEADACNLAAVSSVFTQEPPFNLLIFLIISLTLFEKTNGSSAVTCRAEKSIVRNNHLTYSKVFALNIFGTFNNRDRICLFDFFCGLRVENNNGTD